MAITMRRRYWLAITGRCHRAKRGIWSGSECYVFDNEEQVVNWANDSQYGLAPRYGRKMWAGRIASAHGYNMLYLGQYPFHAGK